MTGRDTSKARAKESARRKDHRENRTADFVNVYDEIIQGARARMSLVSKLREYSEHLEELVEKRTEELNEAQKKLVASERLAAIGELAGMVGHDLRNPLMSIAGAEYYLRTTLGPKLKDKEIQMLNIIKEDVAYSDKIVNDLQDYSKEIRLEVAATNPRRLLEESLSVVNVTKKINVLNETSDKPEMQVDPSRIKRVFINLMKNAVDAMPKGGKLVMTAKEKDGMIEFSFKDTGTGIPKELLEKIGKPLFTTKARGMGFGLAICKRIVEAHEGKLGIESIVGKGTNVKVILPIIHKTSEEGKLCAREDNNVRVTTMTPSPEENTGTSGKRLEIEDILCSKTTMKILKALKKGQRLNTSEITRMIRSNFADTASHLRLLEEQKILAHSNFGVRSRIYRFAESTRANAVRKLLEAWEQETERVGCP